jgi:hypothetical protein
MRIAPFTVAVCPMGLRASSDAVRRCRPSAWRAAKPWASMSILDDRGERPGAMFADWELIGIPHRGSLSDRGLKEGTRGAAVAAAVPTDAGAAGWAAWQPWSRAALTAEGEASVVDATCLSPSRCGSGCGHPPRAYAPARSATKPWRPPSLALAGRDRRHGPEAVRRRSEDSLAEPGLAGRDVGSAASGARAEQSRASSFSRPSATRARVRPETSLVLG